MSYVWNHSKVIKERAHKIECPRCKGAGYIFKQDGHCAMCNGRGEVWFAKSGSSWYRSIGKKITESFLY